VTLTEDFSFGTLKLEENSFGVSEVGITGASFLFMLFVFVP